MRETNVIPSLLFVNAILSWLLLFRTRPANPMIFHVAMHLTGRELVAE